MASEIVVGVDGSDDSVHALRWAGAVAARWGAPLRAVMAWEYPVGLYAGAEPFGAPGPELMVPVDELEADARQRLDAAVAAAALTDVTATTAVIAGQPSWALVETSRDAGLLVIGSHALGPAERLLVGSVAVQCVQHSSVPVAMVRRGDDPMRHLPVREVVVAFDGSPGSAAGLRWALDEADRWGAHASVVTAWDRSGWPAGLRLQKDDRMLGDQVEERLAESVQALIGDRVDAVGLRAVQGRSSEAIVAAAADADLLVMGARGLGGFRGLLLGSVTQRVMGGAPCPLVVVPHADGAD